MRISAEELGHADLLEDCPAYDSGNSTSHSPDEQQLLSLQRSMLLSQQQQQQQQHAFGPLDRKLNHDIRVSAVCSIYRYLIKYS